MLFFNLFKRKLPLTITVGFLYLLILSVSIVYTNKSFSIYYPIEPFIFGSDFPDFIFPIIVSLPFAYYSYYLTKNGFLDYVSMRIKPKVYLKKQVTSCVLLTFVMVFFVNFIGIILSINIADISSMTQHINYNDYILGSMQVDNPIIFGILWSFHKALLGSMMCLLGQIISLYINNLFLALTGTFLFIMLENFLTATLGLPRFSITTAFILNRLDPSVMNYRNTLIAICVFTLVIIIFWRVLMKRYEKN